MLLRACFFSFLLILPPCSARAQARDFMQFRDSLRGVTDVPALYRMERALEQPGTAKTVGPVLQRGLIAIRIHEMTGDDADASRAREAFEKATQRFPSDPWSHYGAALALGGGPEKRLNVLGGALSDVTVLQSFAEIRRKDPRSRARVELRRALGLQPAFGAAAIYLADLAVADGGRSRDLVKEARDALKGAISAGSTDPTLPATLSRMETTLGNYSEAAAASESAAATGDASALRSRAEALLLLPGREEEAHRLYVRALERLTPDAASVMFGDVQVLLTPAEAAEWKRADLQQQADWLTRFWDRRAAESGVPVAERLATHYRRLAVAKQRYVRNSSRGTGGNGVLLPDAPAGKYPYDQRGVVLVRHGPPVAVVTTQTPGALPNETWVYNIPDQGAQLFHFVALRGSSDYALVSDITKAIDPRATTTYRNNALIDLLQDRVAFEPKYQIAASRLLAVFQRQPAVPLEDTNVRNILETFDAEYRRGAREALRTESHRHEYEGDIKYLHDIFTFRTPFSRTEVTAAFAVPAGDLVPLVGSAGTRYALRLSVILLDTLQGTVTRADTAIEIDARRQLTNGEYLRANVTLPVIPSEHVVYKLAVEDVVGGRGSLVGGRRALRDYGNADRLLVSDIVLALPDTAGEWVRGSQRLALALPRSFSAARPFTVFYEVYNFLPGEAYSTRITVTPIDGGAGRRIKSIVGGGAKPIQVTFDGVAAPDGSNVMQEVRQVATELATGRYRMTIEITGKTSGRTASTQTEFTVTD
ncbi:MAG: GWxTD domain-containing protein [Longimicrobiales bacterium]